jgi:hypothetical protein
LGLRQRIRMRKMAVYEYGVTFDCVFAVLPGTQAFRQRKASRVIRANKGCQRAKAKAVACPMADSNRSFVSDAASFGTVE